MEQKSSIHYVDIELKDQILEFVKSHFNVDLSDYSESSVRRRLAKLMHIYQLKTFSDFESLFLKMDDARNEFLKHFTVNVTEMFRDPQCFKAISTKVFPKLKKLEQINIWSAGCSTGEEALSLAILLHENDLLDKAQILATDISKEAIETARNGIYKVRHINTYLKQYVMAGGKFSLERYFTTVNDTVVFKDFLKEKIDYQVNNLITEKVNKGLDLILCRNLLIYFNANLQNAVLENFYQTLDKERFLVLGNKESIIFYEGRSRFEEIADETRIFRKKF